MQTQSERKASKADADKRKSFYKAEPKTQKWMQLVCCACRKKNAANMKKHKSKTI